MTPEFKKQIESVLEKAESASPSPWSVNGDHFIVCTTGNSLDDGEDYHVSMNGYRARDGAESDAKFDAEYIAAAHPDFVQKLCKIALASEGLVEALEREWKEGHGIEYSDRIEAALNKFRDEVGRV